MPFLPVKVANWLHDKNANWAFGLERFDEVGLEQWLTTRIFDNKEIANVFELEQTTAFDRRNPEHIKALRGFMMDFLEAYDDNGQPTNIPLPRLNLTKSQSRLSIALSRLP